MFNAVKWFAGFTIIQLLKNQINNVGSEDSNNCTVTKTDDERLYADCSNRQLTSIRRGLGESLEILNISSNPFQSLKEDDLNEYTHLKELVMRDLNVYSTSTNFLTPLTELDVLDISNTNLLNAPKLPSTITILLADEIRVPSPGTIHSSYNFAILDKLSEIHLNKNHLRSLPALNYEAPLINLYAYENYLMVLELDYLAHFCQLKHLGLNSFHPDYVDNCCYVRLWVDEYSITSELKCDKECEKDKYPFNKTAIEIYQRCTQKVAANESFWEKYGLYLNIGVIGVFIIAIAFLAFKYYRSSAVQAHKRDKKLNKEEAGETADSGDVKEEASVAEEETNED